MATEYRLTHIPIWKDWHSLSLAMPNFWPPVKFIAGSVKYRNEFFNLSVDCNLWYTTCGVHSMWHSAVDSSKILSDDLKCWKVYISRKDVMYHLDCKKEIFVQLAEVLAILLTLKCCGRINSIEDNCFSMLCMWIDRQFSNFERTQHLNRNAIEKSCKQ